MGFQHKLVNEKEMLCTMQQYVYEMIGGNWEGDKDVKITGFKEIRQHSDDLNFMKVLFPCGRYIISTRANVTHQFERSSWKRSLVKLKEFTANIEDWSLKNGDISRILRLEDFSLPA